jgi:CheY-like chemotaxis protein
VDMSNRTTPVVLVADDEPSMLALVSRHVKTLGYEVLEASDGETAWGHAAKRLPDLVVLDVMMPGMSGWEVCRRIRENVALAHTGVIMLTGIGQSLNELTSPLYGADAYIDKPFEFKELDQKIRDVLSNRGHPVLAQFADTARESDAPADEDPPNSSDASVASPARGAAANQTHGPHDHVRAHGQTHGRPPIPDDFEDSFFSAVTLRPPPPPPPVADRSRNPERPPLAVPSSSEPHPPSRDPAPLAAPAPDKKPTPAAKKPAKKLAAKPIKKPAKKPAKKLAAKPIKKPAKAKKAPAKKPAKKARKPSGKPPRKGAAKGRKGAKPAVKPVRKGAKKAAIKPTKKPGKPARKNAARPKAKPTKRK